MDWGDIIDIEKNVNGREITEELAAALESETNAEINSPRVVTLDLAIREGRNRRLPVWSANYVSGKGLSEEDEEANMAFFMVSDPVNFEEAVKSLKWRLAMDEEIISIEKKNQTWRLVVLSTGAKKTGVKWIYKTKLNELGEVDKYKARLVVKGYTQEHRIDYTEVFAPMARMDI